MTDSPLATTDHTYFETRSIGVRAPFRWPGGARVAFAIVVCLESYELVPPPDAYLPPNLPGGFGRAPYPDMRAVSQREYGQRVGIFRLFEAFDKRGLRATAAVDAQTAESCPALMKDIKNRGWDIVAHGLAVTQVISSKMTESDERSYIRGSINRVSAACGGQEIRGWHGPEYGESQRTPELLAEARLQYVLDWPNDEQPYRMKTRAGPLLSIPIAVDFEDVYSHWHRKISMERWARSIKEALDMLEIDGQANGRMLVLNLHPWLIGQPWRFTYFEEVLSDVMTRSGLWHTTTDMIADWANSQLAQDD